MYGDILSIFHIPSLYYTSGWLAAWIIVNPMQRKQRFEGEQKLFADVFLTSREESEGERRRVSKGVKDGRRPPALWTGHP
jgi:hypothetical protein